MNTQMKTNRLLQTFLDLVQIDSPSGFEQEVGAYLMRQLKAMHLRVKKDRVGNVIVKKDGFGEPLLLSAHMDTVEPGRGIKPIVRNGIVKSSGNTILGTDNKVAVAVLLEVLQTLVADGLQHRSLEVVFTVSEEVANLGAINLDYTKLSAKEGYIFDMAGPIGTITTAQPFYDRFDITIAAQAAHASQPEQGINALNIYHTAMRSVRLGRVNKETLVNIGLVQAGYVRNSIPGAMTLQGEVRSFAEEEIDSYARIMVEKFQQSAQLYSGKIDFSIVRENPGYRYRSRDPFIRKTQKIMRSMKLHPVLHKSWGCSDANIFHEHGIKVCDLGNGGQNPHTIDESISVTDMEKLTQLMLFITTNKE